MSREIEEIKMMLKNNEPLITWENSHIEFLLHCISTLEEKVKELGALLHSSKYEMEKRSEWILDVVNKLRDACKIEGLPTKETRDFTTITILQIATNVVILELKRTETRIKELECKRNVKFIQGRADQMVYDAELVNEYRQKKEQAESHLKGLKERIDRHEIFKRTHEKIVALEDEELYKGLKEE